jgi:hypothetical protein
LLIFVCGCSRRSGASSSAWVADPTATSSTAVRRDLKQREIKLEAARNEYVVLQLAARSAGGLSGLSAEGSDLRGPASTIPKSSIRVRYPCFLPVDENGQYTPDPLFEKPSVDLKANQAQPVWIDFQVPADAAPGAYEGAVSLRHSGGSVADFTIRLMCSTLPAACRQDPLLGISLDPGSVARLHKVERWSEAH